MKKVFFLPVVAMLFSSSLLLAQATDAAPKGSPYLNDTYEESVVFLKNVNYKYPARYNVFSDLVEYQQNGNTLVLDPSPTIKKIQLNNTTLRVEKYNNDGKPKFGYFERLDSGKVILYSKRVITLKPAIKGGAFDGTDLDPEYKKIPDRYFIKIGDAPSVEEVTNIKAMIAAFPDKHDELTSFAKKEKISAKKGDELAQLVRYYNSMQ